MHATPSPDRLLTLPAPDAEAAQRSAALAAVIRAEITAQGSSIGFDRYMELALYQPALGYYHAPAAIFGRSGDFVTAPEISPLFGQCLGAQSADVLRALGGGDILEFGAGSGLLACDLLRTLALEVVLPNRYLILELSPCLRARQAAQLATLPEALRERVHWLNALPQGFTGVMIANEVLDAMPVRCFTRRGGAWLERGVCPGGESFAWALRAADPALASAIADIEAELPEPLPEGYASEFNAWLAPWLRGLAASMKRGAALIIDYGYSRREYYHPQRTDGTLICHYRHRAHDDPFFFPGLQDLSASVDFTALAEAAVEAGFELLGYASQAQFLLDTGLLERLQQAPTPAQTQAVKRLLLPGEMGERFRVMALGKNCEPSLRGFSGRGLRL